MQCHAHIDLHHYPLPQLRPVAHDIWKLVFRNVNLAKKCT